MVPWSNTIVILITSEEITHLKNDHVVGAKSIRFVGAMHESLDIKDLGSGLLRSSFCEESTMSRAYPSLQASLGDLRCLCADLVTIENEFAKSIKAFAYQEALNMEAVAGAKKAFFDGIKDILEDLVGIQLGQNNVVTFKFKFTNYVSVWLNVLKMSIAINESMRKYQDLYGYREKLDRMRAQIEQIKWCIQVVQFQIDSFN